MFGVMVRSYLAGVTHSGRTSRSLFVLRCAEDLCAQDDIRTNLAFHLARAGIGF